MKVSERVRKLEKFNIYGDIICILANDYEKRVNYKGNPCDLYMAIRDAYRIDGLSMQEIADQLEACGL